MDQLCIDQFNNKEVSQEVPKMRKYYGNAEVTLIPISTKTSDENTVKKNVFAQEILKKIINSQ
jgi:hypothetical protein